MPDMILIEAGARDARSFEAKVQFARQLSERGHPVIVSEATMPDEMIRTQSYEAVPFLGDTSDARISRVLVIGAEEISDDLLASLHGYRLAPGIPVTAIGRYASAQARIGAQSKLAFALGFEPEMVDLASIQPRPILETSVAPLFASSLPAGKSDAGPLRLFLVIPKDLLEDPSTLPSVAMLSNLAGFDCDVITAGFGKERIRTSQYTTISAFGYSELPPQTYAALADVAAIFGPNVPGERMAAFTLDLMRKAGVVIDCTDSGALVASGAPAVRGPNDLASLAPFLQTVIPTNKEMIGREAAADPWLGDNSFETLEKALSLAPAGRRPGGAKRTRKPRTVFVPTNGVGLGHAQRCSLIAAAMRKPADACFAAFPSCVGMLQSKGFDCLPLVQKSDRHCEPYANDLLNYLRLGQILRPGDKLIFDGGYVFDSIYRTALERRLAAVWIRRGLWQPGQANQMALERERAFGLVIVPDEAFDELNRDYSFGRHVRNVGPVVQEAALSPGAISELREQLKVRFGHDFEKLVVTMLGGGTAADRSVQIRTLCARFDARPDCLHLVVVWPNAGIAADLYGWTNTRIVRTRKALELCQASDLVVSAVGYNSFHEILYHRIPAIFVPQMAGYMDDQERRARAASERGLAVTVLSRELLMLDREVAAFLDDGKALDMRKNLAAVALPETGTAAAARLIEGVCGDGK
ncbi:MAG: glycosyltransferase [Paracoccaceae bacterium]